MRSIHATVLAALGAASILACSSGGDSTTDEGSAAETASTEAPAGSFHAIGASRILGLALLDGDAQNGPTFIADVAAPVSKGWTRVTGTWSSVNAPAIALVADPATPAGVPVPVSAKIVDQHLVVRSSDGRDDSLKKAASYCLRADDCDGQNIVHVECVGRFVCNETSSCGYSCSMAPPATCDGARLQDDGTCVGPDGKPTTPGCCAAMTIACGSATCGVGQFCCNPLASQCAPRGDACAE